MKDLVTKTQQVFSYKRGDKRDKERGGRGEREREREIETKSGSDVMIHLGNSF